MSNRATAVRKTRTTTTGRTFYVKSWGKPQEQQPTQHCGDPNRSNSSRRELEPRELEPSEGLKHRPQELIPKPVPTDADEHSCDPSRGDRWDATTTTRAPQTAGPDATSASSAHATTSVSPSDPAENPTRADEGPGNLANRQSYTSSAVPSDPGDNPS